MVHETAKHNRRAGQFTSVFTTINHAPTCSCYLRTTCTRGRRRRGMNKGRMQNSNSTNYTEDENLLIQELHLLRQIHITSASNHRLGGFHESQSDGLAEPTRASSLFKICILFMLSSTGHVDPSRHCLPREKV